MKAFLLAAGHRTRLRPITDNIPKCLVPIQGMPMLAIWLRLCKTLGVTDVLINLHAHADVVRTFLQQCGEDDVRVHVAEEDRKSTRLNSSHLVISYAVFCLKNK